MKKAFISLAALMVLAFSGFAYGKTIVLKIGTRINQGATPAVNQVGGIQTVINVPSGATPHLIEGSSVDVLWSGAAVNANGLIAGSYTAGSGGSGGTINLAGGTPAGGDLSAFGFGEFATIVFEVPNDSTIKDTDFTFSADSTNPQVLGADESTTDLSNSVSIVTYKEKDFDGDSRADILWRNSATGQNTIWFMNGTSLKSAAGIPSIASASMNIIGVGDFDADGKPDILWRNASTGENSIWFMNGTSRKSALAISSVNSTWVAGGVGDFDADGKPDILWRNTSTGQNVIWLMDGSSLKSAVGISSVGSSGWSIGGVGDFDGDGKSDVLWRNSSTGQNVVWFMNGTIINRVTGTLSVGSSGWSIGGVGDFDADGKADIVWRNASTGQNLIWLMNGTSVNRMAGISSVGSASWSIVLH